MRYNNLLLAKGLPFVAISLFVLCLFLSRFIGLENYPAPHPDEGFWCLGPKNWALFGDALMDGRLHPFLSPVTFVLLGCLFSVADPSLFTARLLSSIVGLLTVGIVYLLGRKMFSRRHWILAFVFGLCSFSILYDRRMMVETQQVFWLALTTYFYLSSNKKQLIVSGICYGISLLVKINSFYIFPAYLCASYFRPINYGTQSLGWSLNIARLREMIIFLVIAILVSFLGYVITFSINPDAFITAYRFELDGQHFVDQNVLFHFGRFGLCPQRLLSLAEGILKNVPVILILSIFGLFNLYGKEKNRADILFAIWLITGSLFFAGQLFSPVRYFLTLFLPFSYFAAKALNWLFDWTRSHSNTTKMLPILILIFFCLYHGGRLVRGIYLSSDSSYYEKTIEWTKENIDKSDSILSAPYIGLSLPNRSYDFYRMIFPYDPQKGNRPIKDIVDKHKISTIISDVELKAYMTPEMEQYLRTSCSEAATFGNFEIYLTVTK